MRLLDPTVETVERVSIDGIQLRQLDREVLQQRIIAVPQEIMFLSNEETFKELLDPYGKLSCEQCEASLAEVGLKDIMESVGGLHAQISRDALSHGQKQLLSLAVAVARKMRRDQITLTPREREKRQEGGILLLDEVTSSVDPETEEKMHSVIFRIFSEYTVISLTHKLGFLDRYDAVYSMSEGRLSQVKDVRSLQSL